MIARQEELVGLLGERRSAVIAHAVTKGLNPDAPMTDSGVEWLGEVPEHWRVGSLRHFTDFFTGWTPPTNDAEAYEGSHAWANISDLGGRVVRRTAKHLSDAAVAGQGRRAQVGDLLFGFKLSVGAVSLAGAPMFTNEAIATFTDSKELAATYAYYMLPLYLLQSANTNIYGAPLLNRTLMRSAVVAVPPLSEQQQIVEQLDRTITTLEDTVAKAKESTALMRERRVALISDAVTGRLDIKTYGRAEREGVA